MYSSTDCIGCNKRSILFIITIQILFLAGCGLVYSQPVVEDWTSRYNGPPGTTENAAAIVVDNDGNVYVTGGSFGGVALISEDIATIKYNSAGVQQWAARYNGPADSIDSGVDIAIDNSGYVYVAGESRGQSTGNLDFVLIKYDAATGNEVWVRRWTGAGKNSDVPVGISLDPSGNIYVAGYGRTQGTTLGDQYVTIKYNPAGDQLWVRIWDGTAGNFFDWPSDITADADGNVYVAGYTRNSTTTTIQDYATLKYNTNGDLQWARIYNGPGNNQDNANSVAADSDGNVYVTGVSRSGTTAATDCWATIKYNSSGDSLWVVRFAGEGFGNTGKGIALDGNGGIYVTGSIRIGGSSTADQDIATIKYNTSGEQQWISTYNGPGDQFDDPYALTVDSSGYSYVTGAARFSGTSVGGNDFVTLAYDPDGVQRWVQLYNGTASGNDQAFDIAIDSDGNVYVTGNSAGGATGTDYATVKYSQKPLPVELASFIAAVDKRDVHLNWATVSEINNSGFEILRSGRSSGDGNNWINLGFVQGSGNASEMKSYSFTDRELAAGQYSYRLKQIDYNGNFEYFDLSNEITIGIPAKYDLSQNYPNPFNPVTRISFEIPVEGLTKLTVYDISGREVSTLVNEVMTPGYYAIDFNGTGLSSGTYFYRLGAGNVTATKKMVLVK